MRRFYEGILQDELKLSLSLSFSFIFLFSFISIYFIVEAYHDSQSYYVLNLETDFLQEIIPGTKVRFQASLIVGEVVEVQTNLKKHHILIRLKKDFQIPKEGSSVSLATWGYFGSKFININTYPGGSHNIPYASGDTVPMLSSMNPNLIIQNFHALLKEDKLSKNISLDQRLRSVKNMIRRLKWIAYKHRRLVAANQREILIEQTFSSKNLLEELNNYLDEINKELFFSKTQIKTVIPKINKATGEFKELIIYKNRLKNFLTRYVYDETDYVEIKLFISAVKRKTQHLLKNPRLLFSFE